MTTAPRDAGRVLVASENSTDAVLVKKILDRHFESVYTSTNLDSAVADCDRDPPAVLVLAFDTLEKSQRYYLGICRHSKKTYLQPHRTVLLCGKDDVQNAYDLCRDRLFDDYVLFWPMAHDAMRLPMAVHIALRELAAVRAASPSAADFATEARRLSGLEGVVERRIAQGVDRLEGAERSVTRARQEVDAVLADFSQRLAHSLPQQGPGGADVEGLQREFERIKRDEIQRHFNSVAASIEPLAQWANDVKQDVQPHLQSARTLKAMADRLIPRILIVDDDVFQHKIIASVLSGENYQLVFAASGPEALALLHKGPLDLILMDVMMPGMNGTETTRRLRASPQFAKVPVVMMTGKSNGEVVSESIRAGATDFVVKPIDRDKLLDKVAKALRSRHRVTA